jgi:hypothetical protein
MGTKYKISCRDHTIIVHISADIRYCTYLDRDIFVHFIEYYTPFNPVTPKNRVKGGTRLFCEFMA